MGGLIKIWRVENQFGNGPYQESGKGNIFSLLTCRGEGSGYWQRRPPPQEDAILSQRFNRNSAFDSSLYSGFTNLKQYYLWFNTSELRDLLNATGFFLTQYQVSPEHSYRGHSQVLFNISEAMPSNFRKCNEAGVISLSDVKNHKRITKFVDKISAN
jgi:hypothetical protein